MIFVRKSLFFYLNIHGFEEEISNNYLYFKKYPQKIKKRTYYGFTKFTTFGHEVSGTSGKGSEKLVFENVDFDFNRRIIWPRVQ